MAVHDEEAFFAVEGRAFFFVFKMMGSNIAGRLGNKLGKKTLTAH